MSKGLEALKEARNFRHEKDKNLVVIDIDYFNKCLENIEIELKRKQNLEQMLHKMNVKHGYKEYLKINKALEIIKEKKVNVRAFLKCCHREDGLLIYNNQCDNKSVMESKELTQEEFDLLKEVL